MSDVLGVVLAGGMGERLAQDRAKALVTVAGRTLLERALATLDEACDEVVVSAPATLALPVARERRVDDSPGADGPLAGLVAGLASRPFARAIVLGVDFPLVTPAFLRALLARLGPLALLPAPGGIPQPLVACYAQAAFAPLAGALASGERSPTRAALAMGARLLDDAEIASLPGGVAALLNVNTPEDLEQAERRLAREAAR